MRKTKRSVSNRRRRNKRVTKKDRRYRGRGMWPFSSNSSPQVSRQIQQPSSQTISKPSNTYSSTTPLTNMFGSKPTNTPITSEININDCSKLNYNFTKNIMDHTKNDQRLLTNLNTYDRNLLLKGNIKLNESKENLKSRMIKNSCQIPNENVIKQNYQIALSKTQR